MADALNDVLRILRLMDARCNRPRADEVKVRPIRTRHFAASAFKSFDRLIVSAILLFVGRPSPRFGMRLGRPCLTTDVRRHAADVRNICGQGAHEHAI